MKKKCNRRRAGRIVTALLLSALVAAGITLFALYYEFYLQGNALYGQLYKLDMIEKALGEGMLYPLYAEQWYNGYEIFRYTPPLPYILIYALSYLAGRNTYIGISVFYGMMAFLEMTGFFLFGIRRQNMCRAFFAGLAFLALPTTIGAAVWQSRFDVVMGLALMPSILFWAFDFVELERRMSLLSFTCLMGLLIMSHFVFAIVVGLMLMVYLAVHMVTKRAWRYEAALAGNLLLVYIVMGYYLYPALSGGLLTKFYSSGQSLQAGYVLVIMAVIGVFLSDRVRMAGFLTALAGLIVSSDTFSSVLKLMPFRALQNPYWYLLTAASFCMVMMVCWKRLRLSVLIVLTGAIVLENVPQLLSLETGDTVRLLEEQMIQDYLLDEAAAVTDNRLALMDNSALGDMPHWYMASQGVNSMYGWDAENGLTLQNQWSLNDAFTNGFYDYVFDRLLLYGNDVVVVLKDFLPKERAQQELVRAASDRSYTVCAENDKVIVFKAEQINAPYGLKIQYENLAIGEYADAITYIYPSFGLGSRSCLEDYTVEELSKYKRLYLSGFTYREKEKAENMLRELSAKGVKIYIDMQHIPVNELTGKDEFMGVYAQFVQFTEDFPVLENDNGNQFKLDFRTITDTTWNTVYVSGCDEVLKEAVYEDKKHLAYLARNRESDVTFMGFNLVYYYLSMHNSDLKRFLDEALNLTQEGFSNAEIVPINIKYSPKQVEVMTEEDSVNCNLAAPETLVPDRILSTQENMWVINRGKTTFRIKRPGNIESIFISIAGGTGMALLWILVYVVLEPVPKKQRVGNM